MSRTAYRMIIVILLIALLGKTVVEYYHSARDPIKDANNGVYDVGFVFEVDGTIDSIYGQSFEFTAVGLNKQIKVVTDLDISKLHASKLNNIIMKGYFGDEGLYHMTSYRMSYFHIFKYILSFVGLIWFMFIFFKEWKLTWTGFEAREQ